MGRENESGVPDEIRTPGLLVGRQACRLDECLAAKTNPIRSGHDSAKKARPKNITEYINAAPKEARKKLREMRACIRAAAPGAKESLKWGMPAFSYRRILVTFAAFKHHIGFYPTPSAVKAFAKDLSKFVTANGVDPVSAGEAASSTSDPQDHRVPRSRECRERREMENVTGKELQTLLRQEEIWFELL